MNHSDNTARAHAHTTEEQAKHHRSLFDSINFSVSDIFFDTATGKYMFVTKYWGCE